MLTTWAQASVLCMRVRGETMVGANCLRAVTTSHIESPHSPLSSRRRATSATACWPRTDWLRASRYRVVLRQSESAACGDISEASHRIQSNFIGELLAALRPVAAGSFPCRGTTPLAAMLGHGVLGRAATLRRFCPGA